VAVNAPSADSPRPPVHYPHPTFHGKRCFRDTILTYATLPALPYPAPRNRSHSRLPSKKPRWSWLHPLMIVTALAAQTSTSSRPRRCERGSTARARLRLRQATSCPKVVAFGCPCMTKRPSLHLRPRLARPSSPASEEHYSDYRDRPNFYDGKIQRYAKADDPDATRMRVESHQLFSILSENTGEVFGSIECSISCLSRQCLKRFFMLKM
jgi:hypothetical protein